MLFKKIIIVGGGLSGLSCAKRLKEENQDFLLISEDIGGRVKTSLNGLVNYGAYYVTEDCKNIKPYISRMERMRFRNYHFHKGGRHYHFFPFGIIKHFSALWRLTSDLLEFRKHFNDMRSQSKNHSRESLIEADPLLRQYYHQLAGEYIKERNLENLVSEFLEQALWASFFADIRKVPTFIFMQCMLPMIVRTYSFTLDFNKLTASFKDQIIIDSILSVEHMNGGIKIVTRKGDVYECEKLVLATPMTITNRLIKPQKIKGAIDCSFFHVTGEIKKEYAVKGYNFFSLEESCAISREVDGSYLYFYTGENKIDQYFNNYKVITSYTWEPALILLGDNYINLNPEPNIFLANDHDVASTEDAFLNGQYAANLLMK